MPVTFYEQVEFSHRTVPVRPCYIEILERWATDLYAISETEAEAEGYRGRDEFLDAWDRQNVELWALRFQIDHSHRPRLLAGQIIAGRQGAYVDSPVRALPDEPEAIDPFTLERLTDEARSRDRDRTRAQRAERAELPFEEQLEALTREAWARHINIRSELRAIERWPDPDVRQRQLEIIREKLEPELPAVA